MRLVEVKNAECLKFYKSTYYGNIIQEFLDSDMTYAEVTDYKCKDACICSYGIRNALKRMKMLNVKCYSLNGKVIMEKVRFRDEHKD